MMAGWGGFAALSVICLGVLLLMQAITFVIGCRIGRYNVVDVVWGLGFVAVAVVSLALGDGDVFRRWLLALLTTVWGVRLSWHMFVKSKGKGEDPRYVEFLQRAGNNSLPTVVRKIFLTQGLSQWFVSLPLQLSAVVGPTRGPAVIVLAAGVALFVIGLLFEAVGDAQLRRFKADPAHRGLIMDRGLWSWTRHPNYFGDSAVWWGLWLIAASAGPVTAGDSPLLHPAVVTILSPVAMTYFLVFATGARLLERAMSSRAGYADYQRRTSYFLPRPPRKHPTGRGVG